MLTLVEVDEGFRLEDYAAIAQLSRMVEELQDEAADLAPRLADRAIWMVSSTARGGGVAEMLPKVVSLLRELGLQVRWATIGSDEPGFFPLTKRIHNMIHGADGSPLTAQDRELYEKVSRENGRDLAGRMSPGDILVVHDPQPMATGAFARRESEGIAIWRCHIGNDADTPGTRAAWDFLGPYAGAYGHAVFSASAYVPAAFEGRATVIHPAVDPMSHKNRPLEPHKLVGVLCNAGFKTDRHPILTPPFAGQARRLRADGSFGPAADGEEIGLLYRPIVCQISRWDRLKGFDTLLEGFVRLKRSLSGEGAAGRGPRHRRAVEITRLVLAGPDPRGISDDPESAEVLDELCATWRGLPPALRDDIAILVLPMESRKENALMVNALQRCSTVVVQNSRREGFGLTATEAMWKRVPVIGTRACGLRQQIRDRVEGLLVQDPDDPDEVRDRIDELLGDACLRDRLARAAELRVSNEFLVFQQIRRWLRLLVGCAESS